ncbi:cyclin-domain-containing protein [Parachaetomium inaequale]|uniref:Cyclin-domain-containing protein n=1 Tax=Parachaetomium inaequale TaxID=2588326 RepID=A0AAN6PGE2_9PEZI|nr:cyclin-domain-containing protein [Parachaetomium inaequale]
MAAIIGDVYADSPSRFHGMIGGHSHDIHYQSRSASRSRDRDAQSHHTPRPTASPRRASTSLAGAQNQTPSRRARDEQAQEKSTAKQSNPNRSSTSDRTARLPSPPPSSSSSEPSSGGTQPQHEIPRDAAQDPTPGSFSDSSASSASTATTVIAPSSRPIPSPDSDSGPRWNSSHLHTAGASSIPPHLDDPPESPIQAQTTIRVRDLAHIQSLARADLLTGTGPGVVNDPPLQQMKYEISGMPIGDIIEMVAALLTKITTTNDLQHDALNRNAHHLRQAQAQARGEDGGGDGSGSGGSMSPLSSSVLAFHGKNVPAITILSYLSRIHKYCPTTYEVFLSLLVYFDRMTERVNDMVMKSEEARRAQLETQLPRPPQSQPQQPRVSTDADKEEDTVMRDRDDHDDDDSSDATETDSELADSTDGDESPASAAGEPTAAGRKSTATATATTTTANPAGTAAAAVSAAQQATYFVVDSFNIHRLIIAGVTCASKFFSDVFYTNSRYAKVGGLPLPELNHLELQFLLLNDFRLAVPVEDLEAYATMLVEFYAREVLAQRARPSAD